MSATEEREALCRLADGLGWEHRTHEKTDVYAKGVKSVEVSWSGPDLISGGSLYQDYHLWSHTRDLATVKSWLKR